MRTHLLIAAILPSLARAGGFEIPDNGAEPLGRGGAFVAKADSGLALQYNVAGFGRQKGTRATIDLNLVMQDYQFTRAGTYPGDPMDERTPWAGQAYPTVRDGEKVFPVPFLGLSTDLGGRLGDFVLAAGIYGPHSPGRHNYGVGAEVCATDESGKRTCDAPPATVDAKMNGLPAPGRYDVTKTNLLIMFPTLAAAWRPHPMVSIGFGWQIVYASFDLANANVTTINPMACPTPDYPGCDAYGRVRASGSSFGSSSPEFAGSGFEFKPGLSSFGWLFGAMLHPTSWLDLGWSFRPGIDVNAEGTIHAVPPTALNTKLDDSHIVFTTKLPAWMRLGARAVARYADGTERADVEVNLVWENWSVERADRIYSYDFILGKGGQLNADVLHHYRDTFGVRAGASYNMRLGDAARLTGRIGAYFDSAATEPKNTRLDFNTMEKWGFTLGGGLKVRGFTFNLAYAFVWSPVRHVGDSQTRAISSTNGTNYDTRDPVILVGNGKYQALAHVLGLGLSFNFSEMRARNVMPN